MKPARRQHLALVAIVLSLAGMAVALIGAETPRGRFTGTLIASERGTTLHGVEVSLAGQDKVPRYRARTDSRGRFTFRHVAAGTYAFLAATNAHEQPKEKVVIREGLTLETNVELEPTAPFLRVFQGQKVFTSRETPTIRCHGFVPVREVAVRVYRLTHSAAIRKWRGWMPASLSNNVPMEQQDFSRSADLSLESSFQHPVARRDMEGVFREEISLGRLDPGMYIVALQGLKTRAAAMVTVTDLGIIVKAAPEATIVYAVNLQTGRPEPDAAVQVLRNDDAIAQGETGEDGLVSLRLPEGRGDTELAVVGRRGESMAVANYYQSYIGGADSLQVYTYTDRPVYRPGQTVYFKTIVRRLRDRRFTVPKGLTVQVSVSDGNGNIFYNKPHTANAFGSLSGELRLPESAPPTIYSIEVQAPGGPYYANFTVAEYKKPEFQVKVTPDRKRYTAGDTMKAEVSAQYYYGAPVADAPVEYFARSSPNTT